MNPPGCLRSLARAHRAVPECLDGVPRKADAIASDACEFRAYRPVHERRLRSSVRDPSGFVSWWHAHLIGYRTPLASSSALIFNPLQPVPGGSISIACRIPTGLGYPGSTQPLTLTLPSSLNTVS